MHIEFVKAVQFSLLVKTGERLREFNFRKLKSPDEEKFSVNVSNDRGDRVFFQMTRPNANSEWEILATSLPEWVISNKNNLRQALDEEVRKWS